MTDGDVECCSGSYRCIQLSNWILQLIMLLTHSKNVSWIMSILGIRWTLAWLFPVQTFRQTSELSHRLFIQSTKCMEKIELNTYVVWINLFKFFTMVYVFDNLSLFWTSNFIHYYYASIEEYRIKKIEKIFQKFVAKEMIFLEIFTRLPRVDN